MSIIDLGAPVTAVWAGAPANGVHALAITRPDGTPFTSPSITNQPVRATFVPDMAGRWRLRWTSSGTDAVGAYSDVVDVWPSDPNFIISLDDARLALNLAPNTDPALLDDLRLYIASATPVIEDIVGPVPKRTETHYVGKGWQYAALYHKVDTLTSVVYDDASVVPTAAYEFDAGPGLLTFKRPLSQGVTITYTTGSTIVPQNVRLATRELVRHWWQQGRQGVRSGPTEAPGGPGYTPSGFAVPKRVIELCGPKKLTGGFA